MDQTDLDYQLPRHLYFQVLHTLRLALPPPATDAPEHLIDRDRAAIAQVAAMLPANGEEAMLAAQVVAANAQALDCLRLVREHAADTVLVLKCTAQASAMMRQANVTRSLLLRIQARRQKHEAHEATCDAEARIEHCAVGLMSDALRTMPARSAPIPSASVSSIPAPVKLAVAKRTA